VSIRSSVIVVLAESIIGKGLCRIGRWLISEKPFERSDWAFGSTFSEDKYLWL